jgi:hypothetical protein
MDMVSHEQKVGMTPPYDSGARVRWGGGRSGRPART